MHKHFIILEQRLFYNRIVLSAVIDRAMQARIQEVTMNCSSSGLLPKGPLYV